MGDPSRVRVTGPLQEYAPGFAEELARLGYKPNAAADQLRLMAHLSRWMDAGHLEAAALTPQVTGGFWLPGAQRVMCCGCPRGGWRRCWVICGGWARRRSRRRLRPRLR